MRLPSRLGNFVGSSITAAKTKNKLNADHLAFLVNQVLTDSTYRENARTLQKAIADANGLSVAADLIEESLGVHATSAGDNNPRYRRSQTPISVSS